MASYGRRAATSPGVSFPGWQYTAYDEIQVYEDAWINSINENLSNISLYPNPTKDNITISLQNFNGNIQTEIYDLIGNRLQSTNETTISLRDYAKGIYILKVAFTAKE